MIRAGRALAWLHKVDASGDYELTLNFRGSAEKNYRTHDDVADFLMPDQRAWAAQLARMQPGDWVRFTLKWTILYDRWQDPYSGAWEYDIVCHHERVRTLRRGHCRQRYRSKG